MSNSDWEDIFKEERLEKARRLRKYWTDWRKKDDECKADGPNLNPGQVSFVGPLREWERKQVRGRKRKHGERGCLRSVWRVPLMERVALTGLGMVEPDQVSRSMYWVVEKGLYSTGHVQ